MAFFLVVSLAWLVCFILSKFFAMWSPGRARRAFRISWIAAALCAGLMSFCLFGMENDHSRDGGGGMAAGIMSAFFLVCVLGALLNVFTCWLGARREARLALENQSGLGFSREETV